MKHLKTFESFSSTEVTDINESLWQSVKNLLANKKSMLKSLDANFKTYFNQYGGEESLEDFEAVKSLIESDDFNIDKLEDDSQKKIAQYLINRAEKSMGFTAKQPHQFGAGE